MSAQLPLSLIDARGAEIAHAGWRATNLFFAPSVGVVGVVFDSGEARRIFVRGARETAYVEIEWSRPNLVVSNVVVAEKRPLAFLVASEVAPRGGRSAVGLLRIDVDARSAAFIPSAEPHEGETRIWVSELLSASADGSVLWVQTGHQGVPRADGGWSVRYHISQVDVASGVISKITRLQGPYA